MACRTGGSFLHKLRFNSFLKLIFVPCFSVIIYMFNELQGKVASVVVKCVIAMQYIYIFSK